MLLLGAGFAVATGNIEAFSDGIMSSCTEAVYFVIGLSGIMAVWAGLLNIAKESGLMDVVAKLAKPMMNYLFPKGLRDETMTMILMSFTANLFGAGNSATVFAIKSMELLDLENGNSSRASDAMCMFVGVSMSMVQLVPITVIQIRNRVGSQDGTSIIVPAILVGLLSMMVSVLLCKYYERRAR
ncbi:MAG: nucleoside recognition domain-containing protein [Anaerovorax sp.]